MTVFQCPKCNVSFASKSVLDYHCREDHPEFHHEYAAPPEEHEEPLVPPGSHPHPHRGAWTQPV